MGAVGMRWATALFCSVASAACAETPLAHIPWPDAITPLGFLAWLVGESRTLRPVGRAFALALGEAPVIPLEPVEDAELMLLLTRPEAWPEVGLIPSPEAVVAATLLNESESCPRGRLSGMLESPSARVGARPLATVYRAAPFAPEPSFELADPSLMNGLSISLPVETNTCEGFEPSEWRAWDPAEPAPLHEGRVLFGQARVRDASGVNGYLDTRRLLRLGPDRLLVVAFYAAYLLERGRGLSDAPEWALNLRSPALFAANETPTAVATVQHGLGSERRVYVGARVAGLDTEWGAVLELDISAAGLTRVQTSTRFPGQLEDLALLPDGVVVALTSRRTGAITGDRETRLLIQPASGGAWVERMISPNQRGEVIHVAADPREPHAVGFEDGSIRWGDLREVGGSFHGPAAFFGAGRSISALTSEPTPSGTRWWATSDAGGLARRDPGTLNWALVQPALPPLMHRCSNVFDDCGRLQSIAPIIDLAYVPELGELLVNPETCDTKFALRARDHCVRALAWPDGPARNIGFARPFVADSTGVITTNPSGELVEWRYR